MPNKVLVATSSLQCSHGGVFSITALKSKLKAEGQKALVKADIESATISAACSNDPSSGQVKCTSATVTTGEATKLNDEGSFVMLDSIVGTTNGTPAGTITLISVGQSKLKAT